MLVTISVTPNRRQEMDNPNKVNEFLAKKAKKINETVAMHDLIRSFIQLQTHAEPKPTEDKTHNFDNKR